MAKDAATIRTEIEARLEVLAPLVQEYHQLTELVTAMDSTQGGSATMASPRQRKRKQQRRQHHNTALFAGARVLTEDQVKEIKSAARKQHVGYRTLMQRHGYTQDGSKRWVLAS
jgi:hypothetical protein